MAVIPQIVSEDRASGAQIIEGSLKFEDKSRLERTTSGTDGNRRTYTFSAWYKTGEYDGSRYLFDAKGSSENPICFDGGRLRHSYNNGSDIWDRTSTRYFRDTNAWYHVLVSVDMTLSNQDDRVRTFINNERILAFTQPTNFRPTQNYEADINKASCTNALGWWINGTSRDLKGWMSNVHLLDGSALEPTDFGFQDPLTNTWRPKKFIRDIPNQKGRVFSNTVTASGAGFGAEPPSKAFNGNMGDGFNNSAGGQWITWNSSSYNLSGNLRIYCKSSSGLYDIYVNGNATKVADTGSSYAWVDCGTHTKINEVQWAGTSYGGDAGLGSAGVYVAAIIVDGVWLRDNMHEYGTHGFFLPLDGNTPVGQDQSGTGNNFTSNRMQTGSSIEKATGGLPILNTVSGGQVASPGTRGLFPDKIVTVASSKFVIDGESQASLHLLRGGTYKFDQSDSSNSGHPLRFSTTDNGSHGGGSEYTDGRVTNGTPGSAGAYTTITVPHNAADTLYYYCTAHSGMGGDISATTNIQKADPYAWKCTVAVPMGHNFDDVSHLVNCTTAQKTTTVTNITRSTSVHHFYNGCANCDGSSGNGGIKIHNHADMDLGTGTFTIECWFWSESNSTDLRTLISSGGYTGSGSVDSFNVYLQNKGIRHYERISGSHAERIATTTNYDRYEWNHFAWVREGTGTNQNKVYINGNKQMEYTSPLDYDTGQHIYLGANDYSGQYPNYEHNGYIQDFRVYKGVTKYTSDFIPASTDPDIHSETPSGTAYGSQLLKAEKDYGSCAFSNSKWAAEGGPVMTGNAGGASVLAITSSTQTFTIEAWVYPNVINAGVSGQDYRFTSICSKGDVYASFGYSDAGVLRWNTYSDVGGTQARYINSAAGVVTIGKWHHLALVSTAGAIKMYCDGKEVASGTLYHPNGGTGADIEIGNADLTHQSDSMNGYISNFRITTTAVYSGAFIPPNKPLTSITGTQMLCCQSNISPSTYTTSIAATLSVTGNVTATSFNPFTDDIDASRGKGSGYSILNAIDPYSSNDVIFTEGNLQYTFANTSHMGFGSVPAPPTGKWYWECRLIDVETNRVGLRDVNNYEKWNGDNITCLYDGTIRKGPSDGTDQTGLGNWSADDVIGVKINRDTEKVQFMRNGLKFGTPVSLTVGTYYKSVNARNSSGGGAPTGVMNYGQKPFAYPQDGYQPLNKANLPSPEVIRPDLYYKGATWSGSGGTQNITSLNFKPDLTFLKCRSHTKWWACIDSVRGKNKTLWPNGNNGESTETHITSWNHNGFTVDDIDSGTANESGMTYASWSWKAGGGSGAGGEFWIDDVKYANFAATGLTAGDITPTALSLGTKSGFCIMTYTGSGTVTDDLNHHLGATPGLVMIKKRNASANWAVKFPQHMTGGQRLELQVNSAYQGENAGSGSLWNAQNPNETRIQFGNYSMTNGSGDSYVAYVWRNVTGLQKFGTYTGNQSTGGPYVYLGFRPAFIIIKRGANGGSWNMLDVERNPGENPLSRELVADETTIETGVDAANSIDFVSDGFKVRSGNEGEHNASGNVYHYAAWAEQPSINLYGAHSNAR